MNKTINLLIHELERVKYGFIALIIAIFGLQFSQVFLTYFHFKTNLTYFKRESQGNIVDYVRDYGPISMINNISESSLFYFSIMLAIVCLLGYCVVIWYRDWFGKNNFFYRLLSLPGNRISIYLSKLATILVMLVILLALQIMFVYLEQGLLSLLIPKEVFQTNSAWQIIQSHQLLRIILPNYVLDLILHYAVGIGSLSVLFLIILVERSYKWVGLLCSTVTVILAFSAVIYIRYVELPFKLFPIEWLLLIIVLSVVISIAAIFVGRYLLEKKISV